MMIFLLYYTSVGLYINTNRHQAYSIYNILNMHYILEAYMIMFFVDILC